MPTAAEIGDRMRRELERALKALELDIDREIRRSAPVDTSHLRRNVIPSVTQPANAEAVSDAAHAAGVAQVLSYKLEQGPLWVALSAPYARFVDARKPFIGDAVDRALAKAQTRARNPVDVTSARASVQEQVTEQLLAIQGPIRPEQAAAKALVRGLRSLRRKRRVR